MSIQEADWSLSQLTYSRPDIWERALDLAVSTTGMGYVDKRPLTDGTIFACGGGYYIPPTPETEKKIRIRHQKEDIERMKREIADLKIKHPSLRVSLRMTLEDLKRAEEKLRELEKEQKASVYVPSGAMEWLLHEVGHWVTTSSLNRTLPNYGDSKDIEAWAFEEAVLSHLGPARNFTPLPHRGGPAFDMAGPIPKWSFRKLDKRIADDDISLEPFQRLWEEWVTWGTAQGPDAPWLQTH